MSDEKTERFPALSDALDVDAQTTAHPKNCQCSAKTCAGVAKAEDLTTPRRKRGKR